jgi:hypothetical protein
MLFMLSVLLQTAQIPIGQHLVPNQPGLTPHSLLIEFFNLVN